MRNPLGQYTNEDAERIIEGDDEVALADLRLMLVDRKREAEAMKGDKAAKAAAVVTIDRWIHLVNTRLGRLTKDRRVAEVEKAMRVLKDRIRSLVPYLRYEGPDPAEWGRFCTDMDANVRAAAKVQKRHRSPRKSVDK